jgi:hypothetical protein
MGATTSRTIDGNVNHPFTLLHAPFALLHATIVGNLELVKQLVEGGTVDVNFDMGFHKNTTLGRHYFRPRSTPEPNA